MQIDLEVVARAIDPVAWDEGSWLQTRANIEEMHRRRQQSNEAARRVAEALSQTEAIGDAQS